MRVIGGEFRSRRLKSIPGMATRPTPDRLRETLFNVLAPSIERAVFLDAYAGTGAVGIEALSRGAARAIFLERSRPAAAVLRENLRALGLEERSRVEQSPAATALARNRADIVFLDPPYEQEGEYSAAMRALAADPPALVVMQHSVRFTPQESYGALARTRTLKQGDNALSFYKPG
ncbi:MAG TPA: 16S rRNA (guanine(966)-N(2))-methyltransferase RsmD [Bryobacteraceae bacterium]|nr:16S rRNA (guanine(966)-N(2))-methyltransferase RsmD [Bryobacteraceae bacterium]